jgi:hypothetical protein
MRKNASSQLWSMTNGICSYPNESSLTGCHDNRLPEGSFIFRAFFEVFGTEHDWAENAKNPGKTGVFDVSAVPFESGASAIPPLRRSGNTGCNTILAA